VNNEELLRAMGMKPKTVTSMESPKVPEDVTVASKLMETSPIGMDEVPISRRENPSKVLDVPETRKEIDTTFSHRDPKKEPTTNELLISLIARTRRTNTLLEQLRNIALGMPITDSKEEEVSQNGEG